MGTRISYESFTPLWLGFVRFVIASIAFVPVLVVRKAHVPRGRDLALVAASGLVGITWYFAAENVGVQLTSASNAALVVASFPAIAILVEAVVRRKRPKTRSLVGAAIAVAGVLVLSFGEASTGANVLVGNMVLLCAGVLWGMYNLVVQAIDQSVGTLELTAYQSMFGALFFVPLVAFEGAPTFVPTFASVAALAFLSLGCSVAAYLLYNWSLTGLPASTCAALLNLIPVFGIVLSVLVLGEPITLAKLVGGAVVLTGIYVGTAS